jgi:hypothetical protein
MRIIAGRDKLAGLGASSAEPSLGAAMVKAVFSLETCAASTMDHSSLPMSASKRNIRVLAVANHDPRQERSQLGSLGMEQNGLLQLKANARLASR